MDGCFCAWNIVNVAGNVFLTIIIFLFFWSFTYLVLGTFGNIQSMETQHKCEFTILIKQNLHILYLSKLNKMFKNAFQNAFKK
jgi:hypothetical protein